MAIEAWLLHLGRNNDLSDDLILVLPTPSHGTRQHPNLNFDMEGWMDSEPCNKSAYLVKYKYNISCIITFFPKLKAIQTKTSLNKPHMVVPDVIPINVILCMDLF